MVFRRRKKINNLCQECGASFFRRGNLKNHVRKFHSDDPTPPSQNRDSTVTLVLASIALDCTSASILKMLRVLKHDLQKKGFTDGRFQIAFMMRIDFITFTKLILPTNQTQSGRNVGNGERVNTLEGEDILLSRISGRLIYLQMGSKGIFLGFRSLLHLIITY